MIQLPGYSVFEQIHTGTRTLVYRGIREVNQTPVIVKILRNKYPTIQEITSLKHEYKITKNLDLAGIVTPYSLESYRNGFALVLEDFAGISLKEALKTNDFKLIDTLKIGIELIKIINQVHLNNIIHKDINPQNIIINLDKRIVKLTDFSIASQLSKEQQNISNPEAIEGTLAYISPEQTGRMNRALDYRSDFYSLGVTLYEMLVGELPFPTTDPMELVHSHIARIPVSPGKKNPNIPKAVADIVMKLLSKTAEDRYQTALGIQVDLEQCLRFLELSNNVPNFHIGQQDFSTKLLIPQKLYGREKEVTMLVKAFERVSQGATELMLVGGYSGIGKSSLVNEIHQPIVKKNGYFIAGKFDQFQRDVPYVSLIQAFRGLMQQFLTESSLKIENWRQKLLQAFGNNGQVIIEVIPEVKLIVGEQLPVPVLGASESQNRFNRTFKEFVRVFATQEHPLVMFVDDLQWADLASLKLIDLLVTDTSIKYLLVIGAYRDNEVNLAHPLMLTIDDIRSRNAVINTIILQNLELIHVNELFSETLNCSPEKSRSLAELCTSKTDANPFFLTQLIKSLEQEELFNFNFDTSEWEWDIQKIQKAAITDNVVDLMITKISNLLTPTQDILKLAACIGNRFNLTVVATVNKKSHFITASQLWEAIQLGLILPLSDAYKTPRVLEEFDELVEYRFLHDRVQQAAYALIPEDNKKIVHLEIGRLLLASSNQEILDSTIFDIINHLNIGQELITSKSEKIKLAELNLIAAKKAKASTAYITSVKLLEKGIALLSSNDWSDNYELTFKFYLLLAECKYLTSNFQQAEELFKLILGQTNSIFDQADVYQLKMNCHMTQGNFSNGIQAGYEALKLFDLHLSESEDELEIFLQQELEQVKINLNQRNIADLFNAAEMTERSQQISISILIDLWTLAYIAARPNLLNVTSVKIVNLSLEYGNANTSSFGYVTYGMILGMQGDYKKAYEFGKLALKLNEKYNHSGLVGKIYNLFCHSQNPYKNHLNSNISLYKKSYAACMESGDLLYGVWAIFFLVYAQFVIGNQLETVAEQISKFLISAQQIQDQNMILAFQMLQRTIWSLQGITKKENVFHDELFNEEKALEFWQSNSFDSGVNWHSYLKMQILYTCNDYVAASNIGKQAEKKLFSNFGFFPMTEHNFYYSLSLTAIYPTVSSSEKDEIRKTLNSNQEKMKHWADNCPDNFLHKYLLVAAEIAGVSNNHLKAINLYDEAIEAAQASEYIQNLALANELAAKFYLTMGKVKLAKPYFVDAYYHYTRWGANSKIQDLEARYSEFISITSINQPSILSTTNSIATNGGSCDFLDLTTVIKASQTLASEIVKDRLLEKLVKIVIENTGADYGLLIAIEDDQLFIEAVGFAEKDEASVQRVPLNQSCIEAPIAIINYVQRTQESIVLANATQEKLYADDDYINKNQPKSILCTSLSHQGKLVGIIYLENNLAVGAFTSQRLEVLKLLCSQISISLQNARLYENLEKATFDLKQANEKLETKVEERTQELQEKNTSLKEQAVQLEQTLQELKFTQNQLIQNEKMSSLGQLVAGVAHEINNPVNFIHANLSYIGTYTFDLLKLLSLYRNHFPNPPLDIQIEAEEIDLDFLKTDLIKVIQSMQIGTKRIRDIVLSLRNFSRLDEAEFKQVDLHEGIDSTLMILQHNFPAKSNLDEIQVIKEYGNLPLVTCYPGQLNQVFMNIIANAIYALEEYRGRSNYKPTISIHTQLTPENNVLISIADNGTGIPEEVRNQIFDPFFTTKPVGKGTGLGLSISHQIIVEKHGGKLWYDSTLGKGTTFVIEIPHHGVK